MPKRIDYQASAAGTSADASGTIDTLATEKSNGNISGYTVEYRDDEEMVMIHVWYDVAGSDLSAGYDTVDEVLSNLPISLPFSADRAPVREI